MQNPRYYRLFPTVIAMLIAGRFAAAARSPVPAQPDATAACDELKHDPLPAWADSPENSKRLTDCGYAIAHLGEYARAQQVFAAALEMAKRRSDRSAQAIALDGDGLTLGTPGHPFKRPSASAGPVTNRRPKAIFRGWPRQPGGKRNVQLDVVRRELASMSVI